MKLLLKDKASNNVHMNNISEQFKGNIANWEPQKEDFKETEVYSRDKVKDRSIII